MPPDDDPNLKAAFGELHRRQREQVPPYAVMREHAMRRVGDPQHHAWEHVSVMRRLAWTAAVCGVALVGWWIGQSPGPAPRGSGQTGAIERVDKLIAAIEQHLEQDAPASGSEYPTDLLLAENLTDFSP